jgi:hypothetical protein
LIWDLLHNCKIPPDVVETLVISALRRLRQEDCEFKASLGYIAIPNLENKNEKKQNQTNICKNPSPLHNTT